MKRTNQVVLGAVGSLLLFFFLSVQRQDYPQSTEDRYFDQMRPWQTTSSFTSPQEREDEPVSKETSKQDSTDPTRPRFIYLIQAPDFLPDNLKGILGNPYVDYIVGSWKDYTPRDKAIDIRGLSWGSGRNALLSAALKRESDLGYQYLYFIFLDDDVTPPTLSTWREFEQRLIQYRPAMGTLRQSWGTTPLTRWSHEKIVPIYYFDGYCNAYHREAALRILPYETKYDHISWRAAQLMAIHKTSVTYRGHVLSFVEFPLQNARHLKYPADATAFPLAEKYLREEVFPKEFEKCLVSVGHPAFLSCIWGKTPVIPPQEDISYNFSLDDVNSRFYSPEECNNLDELFKKQEAEWKNPTLAKH